MATEAELASARAKIRNLREQLDGAESANGYAMRRVGARFLGIIGKGGTAALTGLTGTTKYGPLANYLAGGTSALLGLIPDSDSVGQVFADVGAQPLYSQISVSIAKRRIAAGNGTP